MTKPVAGNAWPPSSAKPRDDDEIQAFAYDATKGNQVRPKIVVTAGLSIGWCRETPTAWRSSWGTSWGTSS